MGLCPLAAVASSLQLVEHEKRPDVVAVVIGRNEGDRLVRCLRSVLGTCAAVVYVDSGSEDQSVAHARELGADVIELDPARPFSAARARNKGFARVRALAPEVGFVQFVDGDCEVVRGWMKLAQRTLADRPELVVVCGRRRERHPRASVYNRLCDLEWDTPIGGADACGGDAMMRVSAFEQVGGFHDEIVAGEEPELCLRLRRAGGRVERLDAEMTLHDAAIHSFGSWWQRVRRGGHAAAEGWWRHRKGSEGFMARRVRSALVWGAGLPLVALAGAPASNGLSLVAGVLLLAAQGARTARGLRKAGRCRADAQLEAAFLMLGKPAEAAGMARFCWRRLAGRSPQLIEYKGPSR